MSDLVYLDHAATTPVRAEVLEAMHPYLATRFGNPSSAHKWGREARVALNEARERVAQTVRAHSDEICFTSGGTEADNFAVLGAWRGRRDRARQAIVATQMEHKAVLESVTAAVVEGAEERLAPIHATGVVNVGALDHLLDSRASVCSAMWVNNETGVIQPVPRIAALCRERGIVFHSDAVQAFGKLAIDLSAVPIDTLTISGHKIGAPKGIGALFIRRGTAITPLLYGGAQNRGRRPGTENVAAVVALARACELAVAERETEAARVGALRDWLERALVERVPDASVNGGDAARAAHITSLAFPGVENESLLMALDLAGIAASAGSACQVGVPDASHVLTAMGLPVDRALSSIRMSLGPLSTRDGVERVAEVLPALVMSARRLSGMAR